MTGQVRMAGRGLPVPTAAGRQLTGAVAATVWLVAAFDIGMMLAQGLVPDFPLMFLPLELGVVAAFGIVGAVLGIRQPRNPIGWILLATSTVASVSFASATYVNRSVTESGGALPATVAVAWIGQYTIYPAIGAVGCFLLLLFPDGHLPSPRWRVVARLSAAMVAVASIVAAITPGPIGNAGLPNPLGTVALGLSSDQMGVLSAMLLVIPCIMAITSVFARYRGANRVERQQLRLLGWTGVLFIILMAIGSSGVGPMAESGWILFVVGLGLVPIAVGIAILRYRLYDIDRIVSRTISWAVVTALLVSVFALAIVGLQALLAPLTRNNTLAVAGSTLLVAALLQTMRGRVQGTVDRQFNRSRIDADRALAEFGERTRDEVDLGRIRGSVVATADAAVSPTLATVWRRSDA